MRIERIVDGGGNISHQIRITHQGVAKVFPESVDLAIARNILTAERMKRDERRREKERKTFEINAFMATFRAEHSGYSPMYRLGEVLK